MWVPVPPIIFPDVVPAVPAGTGQLCTGNYVPIVFESRSSHLPRGMVLLGVGLHQKVGVGLHQKVGSNKNSSGEMPNMTRLATVLSPSLLLPVT
jgi:hypothetical protein